MLSTEQKKLNLGTAREQLCAWREEHGYTIREAADVLGVSSSHLASLLHGRTEPGVRLALRLERLAGVNVHAWGE